MEVKPTLLILAAGMGSRYGGLKQLEPMGPHGETLLDYSVYDAIQAGFGKIVFVIRRDIEAPFRKTIGKRYESRIPIDYAFQELDDLPPGYTPPTDRTKPWGTAHAVFAARHVVQGSFAVINADDYYGADAYHVIARYFSACASKNQAPLCMVGYPLAHTLSNHGAVNRGLCRSASGLLQAVEEISDIERDRDGTILGTTRNGKELQLDPESLVSMNFWGFSDQLFQPLERNFVHFLKYECQGLTAEFYIPSFIDNLIASEGATCELLRSSGNWFGVTYPGDKPFVQGHIMDLIKGGNYPSPLLDGSHVS